MNESQLKTFRYVGLVMSGSFISVPNTVLRAVLISTEMRDLFLSCIKLKNQDFLHIFSCSL